MSTTTQSPSPSAWRLPNPGERVGERYRVVRVIGTGGMGAVVEAVHVATGMHVAIKLMLPDLLTNPEVTARFLREGRVAAALRSDHAVRTVEVGVEANQAPFLVMELLEGEDLEHLVRAAGPLPIADVVGYVLQACHALAEAHGLGIVHRDLKPGNMFLCRTAGGAPSIKVLDFGVSKTSKLNAADLDPQFLTATYTTLGSPRYTAPEQLRDAKRVDARADLWSLGVVLHRLLTGLFPFEARSFGEHLAKLIDEPPTPLRARRPDAPEALEATVQRCLQKRAEDRFQTVGELALALAPHAPPWARPLVPRIVELCRIAPAATCQPKGPAPLQSPPPPAPERDASDDVTVAGGDPAKARPSSFSWAVAAAKVAAASLLVR